MGTPKKVKLNRIPLNNLIEILERLYNAGFDYVDFDGVSHDSEEHADNLKILVRDEYLAERVAEEVGDEEDEEVIEAEDNSEDFYEQLKKLEESKKEKRLSADDINDLLNNEHGC